MNEESTDLPEPQHSVYYIMSGDIKMNNNFKNKRILLFGAEYSFLFMVCYNFRVREKMY